MNFGSSVVVATLVAGAVALAAAYSPTTAERVWPGGGEKARQVRALLPPFILAKLDATLPAPVKAALPTEAVVKPDGEAASAVAAVAALPGAPPAAPAATQTTIAAPASSVSVAATEPVKSAAPAAPARPPVGVVVVVAEKKSIPVRVDSIGTVAPIASVALRSRVDTQIEKIFVADGATVKADDVLVKLDSRQIEAQLRQAEAALAKDRTGLDQATRDVARMTELLAKQATAAVNLENARTQVAAAKALIEGDTAAIENLKVQLTYYTLKAPIPGRIGALTSKAGNMARAGEAATSLGTIVQMSPIYVAFSVPQRMLPDLRAAMERPDANVTATPQGSKRAAQGKVALIDNLIDAATGTITARATFDNKDELLWPGQLCNVRVTLRSEADTITVPREAVQTGQSGNYVYVIEDNVAKLRPVTVARIQDGESIIAEGLKGGESVVLDGALLLTNNARVEVRAPPDAAAPRKNPG